MQCLVPSVNTQWAWLFLLNILINVDQVAMKIMWLILSIQNTENKWSNWANTSTLKAPKSTKSLQIWWSFVFQTKSKEVWFDFKSRKCNLYSLKIIKDHLLSRDLQKSWGCTVSLSSLGLLCLSNEKTKIRVYSELTSTFSHQGRARPWSGRQYQAPSKQCQFWAQLWMEL